MVLKPLKIENFQKTAMVIIFKKLKSWFKHPYLKLWPKTQVKISKKAQ